MTIPPLPFIWDGEAMRPINPRVADRHFVIGQGYRLIEHQQRSSASHNHYFAAMHEAWQNLPEHLAERFPTEDHFRKYLLIRAGYRDERSLVLSSKAEAQRVAAFMKPADDFAVITASEAVVTVYTAKSQSLRAMGKADFEASKEAVLGLAAQMIDSTPAALRKNAMEAA